MTPGFYQDDDTGIPSFVTQARARSIRAFRSDDVGMRGAADPEHLTYAAENGLVLVTCNLRDFLPLHFEWVEANRNHAGIIHIPQRLPLGERVRGLLWLAEAAEAEDLANEFLFLDEWL